MFVDAIKYVTVAAVVLLIPLSWIYVRGDLAQAPHDIDQVIFENAASEACIRSNPCHVSIELLLKHPDTFYGTYVQARGVVRIEFEGDSLYSNERALEDWDRSRSVSLNVSRDLRQSAPTSGSTVEAVGEFRGARNDGTARCYGHECGWSADISVVEFGQGGS